jgi:hypothetical protein
MRSTEIVNAFWDDVWNASEPDAVDRFVDDGMLQRGWVEQASFELYHYLLAK